VRKGFVFVIRKHLFVITISRYISRHCGLILRRSSHVKVLLLVVGAFAKLQKATASFVMSVCLSVCRFVRPHANTLLPLDGFSCNLIFDFFFLKSVENSNFIEI